MIVLEARGKIKRRSHVEGSVWSQSWKNRNMEASILYKIWGILLASLELFSLGTMALCRFGRAMLVIKQDLCFLSRMYG